METCTIPGPREIRYLLELTVAYSRGLTDVVGVINDAMAENPDLMTRYGTLVRHLHHMTSAGGGLGVIETECRRLLGQA